MDDGVEVQIEVPGKGRWTLGRIPLDKLHLVEPQITALSIEGQYDTELTGRLVLPADGPGTWSASTPRPAIYLVTVAPAAQLADAFPVTRNHR